MAVETWKIFEYWLPKLAALLSLFGSSLIVGEVYQDYKTKRYSRHGLPPISRALLNMSVGDIFFSLAWFMASWVVSQSINGVESYETSSHTSGACKFQGFLIQFGFFASISFNASLAVIYLMMFKYQWTSRQISSKFGCFAVLIWMVSLCLAMFPLALNLYHDIGENCWLSAPPPDLPQCQEEESFYAHPECWERTDITNLLFVIQILPVWICILLNARIMFVIWKETKKMEVANKNSSTNNNPQQPEEPEPMGDGTRFSDEQANALEEDAQQQQQQKVVKSWRRQRDDDVKPVEMAYDEMGIPVMNMQQPMQPATTTSGKEAPAKEAPAKEATTPKAKEATPPKAAKKETIQPKKEQKGGKPLFQMFARNKEEDLPTPRNFFGWTSSAVSGVEPESEVVAPDTTQQSLQEAAAPVDEEQQQQQQLPPRRQPIESDSQRPSLPQRKVSFDDDSSSSSSSDEDSNQPAGAPTTSLDKSATSAPENRRSRTVARQGIWYIAGFFFTYLPGTINVIVMIAGAWSDQLYRASLFFLALQGAWNFVVFSKGRKEMKTWLGGKVKAFLWETNWCCCRCLPEAWVPPSPGSSLVVTPRTSRASRKKSSDGLMNLNDSNSTPVPAAKRPISDNTRNSYPMIRSDMSTEVHNNRTPSTYASVVSNASTVVIANLPPKTTTMVSIAEDEDDMMVIMGEDWDPHSPPPGDDVASVSSALGLDKVAPDKRDLDADLDV